jgi:hypothetical protein
MRQGVRSQQTHTEPSRRILRRPAIILALATAGALAVTGTALGAASSTMSFSFICSSHPLPNTCPQSTYTKGGLNIHTHTNYTNPGSPDGGKTKRIQIFFDNDFRFNTTVTPRCDPSQLSGKNMAGAMAACGPSLIGNGTGQAVAGSSTLSFCALPFNATVDANGDPRIALYFRGPVSNPSTGCSDPANNTAGSTTLVPIGTLRTTPIGDYRRELDIPNIHQFALPVSDFNINLIKNTFSSGYVQARCGDVNRVWNVITHFTYNNNTQQTVNSTRTCRVA